MEKKIKKYLEKENFSQMKFLFFNFRQINVPCKTENILFFVFESLGIPGDVSSWIPIISICIINVIKTHVTYIDDTRIEDICHHDIIKLTG